jgi:hypothetical protein
MMMESQMLVQGTGGPYLLKLWQKELICYAKTQTRLQTTGSLLYRNYKKSDPLVSISCFKNIRNKNKYESHTVKPCQFEVL